MLLLHLLGGDHRLLVNFTLGDLASSLVLLLVFILAFLLGALGGAAVHAGLIAVALPTTAHGDARIGDPCAYAGLLTFQQLPVERTMQTRV